jgi:murein DD-endopeptidase MepM/ murein hydrolase activator NlpD
MSITTPSRMASPVVARALVAAPPRARVRRARPPRLPRGVFVHPLPGEERAIPSNDDRLFGAPRPGERAPECGAGHCGVDLGHTMGTPVLAVRDGSVFNIVRRDDSRGGRWIQLRHADGMSTYYMHLDEIRSDLAIGDPVGAGEPIGTLGKTGIHRSAPHLHFAITMLDGSIETYVDPLPLLRESTLIPSAEFPDDDAVDVARAAPDPETDVPPSP